MNTLLPFLATLALLGSALVGGVFFAFSSFVMGALTRLPPAQGIAAMQSINVVVINRSFLSLFLGTALLSLVMAGFAIVEWDQPSALFYLSGAICYFVGTFLVTGRGNVPLNDKLAAVSATEPSAKVLWVHYQQRWMLLNHVRTVASTAAALSYALGLMQHSAV